MLNNVLSVFPWYGGKHIYTDILVQFILKAKHIYSADTYIEPYLGGGRMFLNLPDNFFRERLINELNVALCTLWKVILTNGEMINMIKLLKTLPTDKETFKEIQARLETEKGLDDITKAAYTYYTIVNSRDSAMKSYSHQNAKTYYNKCNKLFEKIIGIPRGKVSLMNRNALEIIEEYGKDNKAVMFLDPPYWEKELVSKNVYKENKAVSTEHHEKLIELLCSDRFKAKVILCGYYRQTEQTEEGYHIYDKLLKNGFNIYRFEEKPKRSSNKKTPATEYIWINY